MFKRDQVSKIIGAFDLATAELAGPARAKNYFLVFDTFETLKDPVDYFLKAMETELEHGRAAAGVGANVTDDDPMKTAQIVVSHLCGIEYGKPRSAKPCPVFPQYYDFLWWMEKTHEMWAASSFRKHSRK